MKRLILLLSFLLATLPLFPENLLTGYVADKSTHKALIGANVMIKNAAGKLLKLTITRGDGTFQVKIVNWDEGLTIQVSMIGMKTYSTSLRENMGNLMILMEEDTQELKEVVVKAGRIRESGDTVTYRVAGFAQKQDRTIGDVLQRMPGIDVAANGKIQYQGIDINKFYIEGNDLLGGKYGVATQGISHEDIGAVEVLENHQPIRVLGGLSFSDQAALNLKLKDKAKATWLAMGYLGGGWSNQPAGALWDSEMFLMTVKSRYQTINTVKSNNTGIDLRNHVTDFFAEQRNTELGDYISVQLPATLNLKAERTAFNRSWMLSSSHLWKVKTLEIKAQVDYYNHQCRASSSSVSTYFLDNGEKVINEDRIGKEHSDRLTGKFSIEANEKNYYLNNTMQTEINWNRLEMGMSGTLPNSQYAKIPDYYALNRLKIIKRLGGKHLITFNSVNEWESRSQSLSVDYADNRTLSQEISNHAFYTNERVAYGFYLNGLTLSLEGGLNGYLRGMNSGGDELTTNYISFYASPKLEYAFGKMELTLKCPFNYTYYKFNQHIGNQSEYFHSPSLNIRWQPTPRFSLAATGGLGRSPISLHDIYGETILRDYRTYAKGVEKLYANSRKHISGRILYRHTICGIFANAMIVKSWSSTPYKVTQHFTDDFIIYAYEPSTSYSQSLNVIGNFSKTLDFMDGSISVNGGYTKNDKNIISEDSPTQFHYSSWNIGGRLYGNITDYASLSYNIIYSRSMLDANHEQHRNLDQQIHSFALTISPLNSLSWQTEGEYYRNEIVESNYKHMLLLNTKLVWKVNRRLELAASLTNILNRKEYAYTVYNNLSSVQSTRFLRGRECLFTVYLRK